MGVGAQPMERGGSSGLVAVAAVRKDTGAALFTIVFIAIVKNRKTCKLCTEWTRTHSVT